jgi:hypothetical protein
MDRWRRYNRRDDSAGVLILLFLAAEYMLVAFEQNPLLGSLGGGLLFTLVIWLVWT